MQNKVLLFFSLCFIGLGFSQEKTKGFSLKEAVDFAVKNNYNVKQHK